MKVESETQGTVRFDQLMYGEAFIYGKHHGIKVYSRDNDNCMCYKYDGNLDHYSLPFMFQLADSIPVTKTYVTISF